MICNSGARKWVRRVDDVCRDGDIERALVNEYIGQAKRMMTNSGMWRTA